MVKKIVPPFHKHILKAESVMILMVSDLKFSRKNFDLVKVLKNAHWPKFYHTYNKIKSMKLPCGSETNMPTIALSFTKTGSNF